MPRLTLTRKESQTIVMQIGEMEPFFVTLAAIEKNRARIVIDAPREVKILRSELVERVARGPEEDAELKAANWVKQL